MATHSLLNLCEDLIKPYIDNQDDGIKQTLTNFEESITGEVVDSEPYVLRQGKGNLADMDLVGGSLAWNQLVVNGNFANGTSGWQTVDVTVSNNIASINATRQWAGTNQSKTPINGHKYLLSAEVNTKGNGNARIWFGALNANKYIQSSTNGFVNYYLLFASDGTGTAVSITDARTSNWTEVQVRNVMLIDLTALFGSTIADYIYSLEQATAGAGVAWFRKYFPNAYYGYQSGKIESINVASRKVVGKNLLPMTLASIKAVNTSATWAGNVANLLGMTFTVLTDGDNNVTGVNITGQNNGGTAVFGLASHNFGNSTFDSFDTSSTEYIATSGITGDSSTTYGIKYQADIQTTYIRIASGYNFGTGKTIQPMIRLATVTDTTYEPPRTFTYPLDSSKQLRGIPKLVDNKLSYDGDIYKADGSVYRKYGVITLDGNAGTNYGFLNYWESASSNTKYMGRTARNVGNKRATVNVLPNIISDKFITKNIGDYSTPNVTISAELDDAIYIYFGEDSGLDTTDKQLAWLAQHPVTVVYELATPTTESAEPFQNPQRAFIDGTEEFVDAGVEATTRDVAIPVGNNTTYQLNETLPPIEDYVDGTTALIVNDIKVLEKDRDIVKFSLMNRSPIFTRVMPKLKAWVPKVWGGKTSFMGYDIWTDGDNIYYSGGSSANMQCVLDKKTSTWIPKVWNGDETTPYGYYIWSDGDNIYHNSRVYNKGKSSFISKTWNGLTNFYGYSVWTDGDNIYYSNGTNQYVLDKATSTWVSKTWNGLTNFNGGNIWSDGDNIYYSSNENQYVLDKMSSTWVPKTWTGCTNIGASNIWSDGDNIYYSSNEDQYVLKTVTLGSTR